MHDTAVFFDFDGVIHNTFAFHLEHIRTVFGVDLSAEDFRHMYDGNFYKNDVPSMQRVDWGVYENKVAAEQALLEVQDDVAVYLKALAEKHALFLVTSGSRTMVRPYLQNNDLLAYFTDELYYEDGLTKAEKFKALFSRYSITAERSVFVTDTLGDVREASEVGLRSIAVTFGYHDRVRLEQGEPYAIVDSWGEVRNAVATALQV